MKTKLVDVSSYLKDFNSTIEELISKAFNNAKVTINESVKVLTPKSNASLTIIEYTVDELGIIFKVSLSCMSVLTTAAVTVEDGFGNTVRIPFDKIEPVYETGILKYILDEFAITIKRILHVSVEQIEYEYKIPTGYIEVEFKDSLKCEVTNGYDQVPLVLFAYFAKIVDYFKYRGITIDKIDTLIDTNGTSGLTIYTGDSSTTFCLNKVGKHPLHYNFVNSVNINGEHSTVIDTDALITANLINTFNLEKLKESNNVV